ncbi:MAG: hypothetical protein ACOX18_00800 [Bacillota bacterium]|jgi:hypothetical protein
MQSSGVERIAEAYGLPSSVEQIGGTICLRSHLGPAVPSLHSGGEELWQWLGSWLATMPGQLGRLSLSRLVPTPTGQYAVSLNGEQVVLSTWEMGPACDPYNIFECFSVLTGVAHVHRLTQGNAASPGPDWISRYRERRQRALQIIPPPLGRRERAVWERLLSTWVQCANESLSLLAQAQAMGQTTTLVLGIESFADFIYLAEAHMVHYNRVPACRFDSPAVDIVNLLQSCQGDQELAERMILSYEKTRPLEPAERKETMAHLWFPQPVRLGRLSAADFTLQTLRRLLSELESRIALISNLEELLLPEEPETELLTRKEDVLDMSEKRSRETRQPAAEPVQPVVVPEVEPSVEPEPTPTAPAETEGPVIRMEKKEVERKPLVWGPFPRPLGASPEPEVTPAEQSESPEQPEEPAQDAAPLDDENEPAETADATDEEAPRLM